MKKNKGTSRNLGPSWVRACLPRLWCENRSDSSAIVRIFVLQNGWPGACTAMREVFGGTHKKTNVLYFFLGCPLLFSILLTSCSSSNEDTLQEAIADTAAYYQILDLENGSMRPIGQLSDLASNSDYRNRFMVFRLIPEGTSQLGSDSSELAHQEDEESHSFNAARYYISVFEVSQGQWQYLDDSRPWETLRLPDAFPQPMAAQYPAYGISHERALEVLRTSSTRLNKKLSLPSNSQWEYACRAGSNAAFCWGDSPQIDEAGRFAQVFETQNNERGPQAVGLLMPNAYGLYDMHGNVWELSKEGHIRGGSWQDPLSLARSANQAPIDTHINHTLVGLRILYSP